MEIFQNLEYKKLISSTHLTSQPAKDIASNMADVIATFDSAWVEHEMNQNHDRTVNICIFST